jgi:hypothetical protein
VVAAVVIRAVIVEGSAALGVDLTGDDEQCQASDDEESLFHPGLSLGASCGVENHRPAGQRWKLSFACGTRRRDPNNVVLNDQYLSAPTDY